MNLHVMAETLELTTLVAPRDSEREVTGGYASDLLSCVIAGARAGNIWVTVQTHSNIIAVASLTDLAGIIISEIPDVEHIDKMTIEKATEEGVALYTSPLNTFAIITRLSCVDASGVHM